MLEPGEQRERQVQLSSRQRSQKPRRSMLDDFRPATHESPSCSAPPELRPSKNSSKSTCTAVCAATGNAGSACTKAVSSRPHHATTTGTHHAHQDQPAVRLRRHRGRERHSANAIDLNMRKRFARRHPPVVPLPPAGRARPGVHDALPERRPGRLSEGLRRLPGGGQLRHARTGSACRPRFDGQVMTIEHTPGHGQRLLRLFRAVLVGAPPATCSAKSPQMPTRARARHRHAPSTAAT